MADMEVAEYEAFEQIGPERLWRLPEFSPHKSRFSGVGGHQPAQQPACNRGPDARVGVEQIQQTEGPEAECECMSHFHNV